MTDWLWKVVTLVLFLVGYGYVLRKKTKEKKNKNLPPGPKGYPLLGSLNLLGKNPHRDLQKLSQKYGPIMHIKLGIIPTIVVSSPKAAELFLKIHDLVFASRPPHEAFKHISWEQRNLSFAPYGSYWRDMRKMCTLELLSSLKINSFRDMRRKEIGLLIEFAKNAASDRTAVDLSAKITTTNANMSCEMVLGKKYSDDEFDQRCFKEIVQEGMHLAATPNLGDYIPFLAPLDLQGLTKCMKAIRKVFDDFLDRIIDEHIQSKDKDDHEAKDFVDVMLKIMGSEQSEYNIERPNIKAIILDMLVASLDTSSTTIEWTMSEHIKHPTTMKKLQEELKIMVGMERMVEESDLEKLPYLEKMRMLPQT
ncbi:cytochrome P450 71AU50-like [Humulus lupulus]|uniref:cytochrome P450 71AU50-like n=1 Tax=Humulus lupulus TaxID=3486 RepID=UPI002B4027D8|nr:cytochrome P450 71AU50-like [Humulus lupulus]